MTIISVHKRAGALTVSPATPILPKLEPQLRFDRVKPVYGKNLRKGGGRGRKVDLEKTYLYQLDLEQDTLVTFAGFLDRILATIQRNGFEVSYSESGCRPWVEPDLAAIAGVEFRKGQMDMLATIMASERAQLNGLTAMGKTFLIKQIVRAYPYENFRIAIVAQQRPVVQAIYRDLQDLIPGEVGMTGCGNNNPQRVTVSTAKSMYKTRQESVDMVLYDEVHTAGGEKTAEDLMKFIYARMYGFSASVECRSDRSDPLVEALFGPVRVRVEYSEGVEEGYVPEIATYFYRVKVPSVSSSNPTVRKRKLIWRNKDRNQVIQSVARWWSEAFQRESGLEPQILVITDTFEHVARLWALMPEYTMVYSSADPDLVKSLQKEGILPGDFRPLRPKELLDLQTRIESGGIRKIVSTTTLGTGVDFRHLDVCIRADGGASEVSNIQFRGRVTRGERGVYCDFLEEGDSIQRDKARARKRSCEKAGWTVNVIDPPVELL